MNRTIYNQSTPCPGRDPACYCVDDRAGSLLKNAEIKRLIVKAAGKKAELAVRLVGAFRIRTLLKLPFLRIDARRAALVERYLQTIKKPGNGESART